LKIQKNRGKRIGEILIDLRRITQDEINWILGKKLKYVLASFKNIDGAINRIFHHKDNL